MDRNLAAGVSLLLTLVHHILTVLIRFEILLRRLIFSGCPNLTIKRGTVVDVVPFTSPSALGKLGRLPVVVTPSSEFKMSLKSAPFIENRIEGRAGSTKNAEVRSCTVNTGDGASTCMSLSRLATLECIGDDGFPLDVDPLAAGVDVVIVVAVALLGRRGVN